MSNKTNPLSGYFRAPKMYVPIPSGGKFYTDDVVEMPETKELPIFAMTGKDEMIMKNPDALLNGEAVSEVIKSCCPNVKNPRQMLSSDVDVLLVAVQGATVGDLVEVSAKCPKCKEDQKGDASIESAIESMAVLDDIYLVEHEAEGLPTLKIEIRPFTYESSIQAGVVNFQSTRSLQALAEIKDEMARLRAFNENFKKIAALNFSLIADSIASITYNVNDEDHTVTDRKNIIEFLDNSDSSIGKAIEEKIKEINAIGINHEMQMQCETCLDDNSDPFVFTGQVSFDPVNFFTAS
jgi:hypothetical protein